MLPMSDVQIGPTLVDYDNDDNNDNNSDILTSIPHKADFTPLASWEPMFNSC